MATPVQENLVTKNKQYASSFTEGHLALPPAKKYAVGRLTVAAPRRVMSPFITGGAITDSTAHKVTCMDARIDPAAAYGISLGDAHVIRNAGGNAVDALRSLVISEQLLGTNEVLIIKHTGCGMLTFKNEDAHAVVAKNLGSDASKELGGLDFQPFPDLEKAVASDVDFLKKSKAISDSVTITGWIYEVETGKVEQVV